MRVKLTPEEKQIEKEYDKYIELSSNKIAKIEGLIDRANQKKAITLRMNENDLEHIRHEAEQEGIPYQTLIASVLHKYITNQLIDEKSIRRVVGILR
ncbi:MAG: CopG family antitoxin [bacterium]